MLGTQATQTPAVGELTGVEVQGFRDLASVDI